MMIDSRELSDICNLPEDELQDRKARLREELFAFVRKREESPTGLVLYFDETSARRRQLEEFVEVERVCCSSIDWSVRSVSGELLLEINGIDPKSSAFSANGLDVGEQPSAGSPRLWGRAIRSIGLGSVGALLACCVLPLGVAAVIGATPLLLLDNPWVIAASAFGLGALLWRWEGRRLARRAEGESAPGCGC